MDNIALRRDVLTWDELAAEATGSDKMNREDRSLVELARLVQTRNDEVSVEEQIRMVDELMTIALENPKVFEHQDSRGWLPLHSAVENNLPLACIKILAEVYPKGTIKRYAHRRGEYRTVIHAARTIEAREILLDHAFRNLHSSLLQDSWDEIHFFFQNHYNIEYVVQRLVEEFPGFLQRRMHSSMPCEKKLALHYAVEQEAPVNILEILVSAYPKALVARDELGGTPLHVAIGTGRGEPNVLRLLMSSKSVRVCNKDGKLPLHYYIGPYATLDLGIIQTMVELFPKSVRKTTKSGATPLHLVCGRVGAADHQTRQVIRFLMDLYPPALRMKDNIGRVPLCCICWYTGVEMLPVIRLLVEACPESVRQLNPWGNTVLHGYLSFAHREDPDLSVVEYLVRAYPDSLKIKDKVKQLMPLDIACKRGYEDIVRLMVSECPEVLEHEDGIETPLHRVCSNVNMFHAQTSNNALHCTRYLDIIRALAISEKAVTTKDSLGQTPLHLLSKVGARQEFLRVIVEKAPNASGVKDRNGRLPLHAVIDQYTGKYTAGAHEHVVHFLLEAYPLGVRCMDNDGMTPLMLACERDASLNIIYQLVKVDPLSNRRHREWSQVPFGPSRQRRRMHLEAIRELVSFWLLP